MIKLIQELKTINIGYDSRRMPGYVVEVWVPTKNGPKLERHSKGEGWWLYGRRRAGKGLAFFIRVEGNDQQAWIKHELARLGGEWRGKPGSSKKVKPRQLPVPQRKAS